LSAYAQPLGSEAPKRFLTIEDCTWLEDPEDPRYGKVHVAQWEAINAICANIGVKEADRQFLLLTARQAAKTTTMLLAAIKTATERPGSKTLYVSFDLATGQELIFEPAQQWLRKLGWNFRATQGGPTGLRIKLENGSIIQCRSADDLRAAGRLRGRGWALILGDELQEMLDILRRLFDEVLGATTLRWSGVTVGAFTPPDVQVGWLWEQYKSGLWALLGWPMSENPFLPEGAAELWMKKRGITIDHPIARREILGLWEPNTEKQVYEFDYQINVYDPGPVKPDEPAQLPTDLAADQWAYGVGGDIGWVHPSSVTFAAWNLLDVRKRIWEVLTLGAPGWTTDKWFEVLMNFRLHIKRKPFRSVVMDQAGSGGLNVVHTLEARFRQMGLPIELTYKPANVPASVGLTNEQFRTGRLLLRKDSPLLEEIPQTLWKDGSNRTEVDKGKFDPHGLDGLRYMVWGATNFRAKAPPEPPPKDPEKRRELEIRQYLAQQDKARKSGRWGIRHR
jgi:hypothetical protein